MNKVGRHPMDRRRCTRPGLAALTFVCLLVFSSAPQGVLAQTPGVAADEAEPVQPLPPAIKDIQTALNNETWQIAISLADRELAKPMSAYDSPLDANWNRSMAYMARSAAYLATGDAVHGGEDWRSAIMTGAPVRLIAHLIDRAELEPGLKPDGVPMNWREFELLVRTGAELGDTEAASALHLLFYLRGEEAAFWGAHHMLATFGFDEARFAIRESAATYSALARYSLAGPPFRSTIEGLPGRNAITTLVVDKFIRTSYEGTLSFAPDYASPPPQADIRQVFDDISRRLPADQIDAFLLVPSRNAQLGERMIALSASEIAAVLTPGDTLFVRCGALSHVTTLYRIDRDAGFLYFADPLFQFWRPSHNGCVTSFELAAHVHGRYLTRVRLDEVTPMLQAALTIRDALTLLPIGWMGLSLEGGRGSSRAAGPAVTQVVENGPAALAGIRVGDVVVTIDGARTESVNDVLLHIRRGRAGQSRELTILRGGERLLVTITMAAEPTPY